MKQSEQSKIWMRDALFSLMKKEEYSSITIKAITEKAGVSRLTFYRNFESKEDIIRYHIEVGFNEYMKELKSLQELDLRKMIALCYMFWEKHRKEILLLSSQNLGWLLREPFEDCLQSILKQMKIKEKYTSFQIQFLIGGMISDMLAWLKNSQGKTPDDMANEILSLIRT